MQAGFLTGTRKPPVVQTGSPNPRNATVHVRALPDIASGPHSSSLLFELGKKEELGGRLIATGLNLWPGRYNASLWSGGYEHPEKAYLIWKLLDHAFG